MCSVGVMNMHCMMYACNNNRGALQHKCAINVLDDGSMGGIDDDGGRGAKVSRGKGGRAHATGSLLGPSNMAMASDSASCDTLPLSAKSNSCRQQTRLRSK